MLDGCHHTMLLDVQSFVFLQTFCCNKMSDESNVTWYVKQSNIVESNKARSFQWKLAGKLV